MFARLKGTLYDALRWSEGITRTDMVYAAEGGFWLTLSKALGLFSSFLFAIAMANLVSPHTFGMYKFVLSGAAIIGAFSLTGMGPAVTQAVARGFDGALRSSTSAYFRWSSFSIAAALVVSLYYFLNGNTILAGSFLVAALCNPVITGFSFF